MNQVRIQIVQKLNAIVQLIKHCAATALPLQNQALMQEITLAIVTHEGLCKLFEQEGPSQNFVSLINEFGNAVAELYAKISAPKTAMQPKINLPPFHFNQNKNLLN